MRYLILGAGGMLGHKLYQLLGRDNETFGTVRRNLRVYQRLGLFDSKRVLEGIDVLEESHVETALTAVRPDVVVNAVGVVKQHHEVKDPRTAIKVNSLLPHVLSHACERHGCRLVHFSTDCVFSGRRGRYTDKDDPDPVDLYGRSKLLGEVDASHALTLRTSIIGREIQTSLGLVEWFLNQPRASVEGYARAIYTGFTTIEMAKIVQMLCRDYPGVHGVLHVSSEPIAKYDLLLLIKEAFNLPTLVGCNSSFECDRSLVSDRFRALTGYKPPSWADMIAQLRDDRTPYAAWRQALAEESRS